MRNENSGYVDQFSTADEAHEIQHNIINEKYGILTFSLDLELYWGVRDKRSIEQYEKNLQGVKKTVSALLRVFNENDIHAT